MKILINFVAFIAFIAQSIFFEFSALNQKKPEAMMESLYNYLSWMPRILGYCRIYLSFNLICND